MGPKGGCLSDHSIAKLARTGDRNTEGSTQEPNGAATRRFGFACTRAARFVSSLSLRSTLFLEWTSRRLLRIRLYL